MKMAEYPQRRCRLPVAGPLQDWPCDVAESHPGPCATVAVPDSVIRREGWEAANPGWEQLMKHDDPFAQIKP